MLEGSPNPARGTGCVLVLVAALALAWGAAFHARTVLAFGLAETSLLALLFVYPRIVARALSVARTMHPRAFEDDQVDVTFAFENRSRLPIFHPEVEDWFVPDKEPRRRAPLPGLLPGRTRALAKYRASCFGKRGSYRIGPAFARVACPLGLFPRDVRLEETVGERRSRSELVVFPRAVPLPPLPASGRSFPFSSSATSRQAGPSAEVLSVREYRAGDSLQRVHWPTSARQGKLAVLELELAHTRDVTIFVDLDRRTLRGLGRRSTLEYSVRIAASAAAAYLAQGDRVGLFASGREPLVVPPAAGEAHLAFLLERLAHLRLEGETDFERVLADHAGALSPGSTAFVVFASADCEPRARAAAVAALRARGCSVVAVLLDERTFLAVFEEQLKRPDERIELSEASLALVLEGALVFAVSQGDDLAERFLHPFGGLTRPRR
jgi:uncharacterized protein (DUF58 family)